MVKQSIKQTERIDDYKKARDRFKRKLTALNDIGFDVSSVVKPLRGFDDTPTTIYNSKQISGLLPSVSEFKKLPWQQQKALTRVVNSVGVRTPSVRVVKSSLKDKNYNVVFDKFNENIRDTFREDKKGEKSYIIGTLKHKRSNTMRDSIKREAKISDALSEIQHKMNAASGMLPSVSNENKSIKLKRDIADIRERSKAKDLLAKIDENDLSAMTPEELAKTNQTEKKLIDIIKKTEPTYQRLASVDYMGQFRRAIDQRAYYRERVINGRRYAAYGKYKESLSNILDYAQSKLTPEEYALLGKNLMQKGFDDILGEVWVYDSDQQGASAGYIRAYEELIRFIEHNTRIIIPKTGDYTMVTAL